MAEPDLSAPAELVRRLDPGLFATALFAAEPGRERLLTVQAVDVELSRAVLAARSSEAGPIIAAMRLQWWRDVATAAAAGRPAPAHEIAGPFADLVRSGVVTAAAVEPLIDGYEAELDGVFTGSAFRAWAAARFGAQLRLAVAALEGGGSRPSAPSAALSAGVVKGWAAAQAAAFALRTAAAMARDGRSAIPDMTAAERDALAVGEVTETLTARALALSETGLSALSEARRESRSLPRAWLPAFLPLRLAAPVLNAVRRDPGRALRAPSPINPAVRALSLSWAVLRGRW